MHINDQVRAAIAAMAPLHPTDRSNARMLLASWSGPPPTPHTPATPPPATSSPRDGDYLLPIKGNTPTLQAQVRAALAGINTLRTPADDVTEEHLRGQIFRRSIWLADATDIPFPGAAQAYLLRRDVFDLDGTRRRKQIIHGLTSLHPADHTPAAINTLARGHWTVENKVHYVRDVTWSEDANQTYTATGPRMMAALRNLALSILSLHGITKIRATLQHLERRPSHAIALLNLPTN